MSIERLAANIALRTERNMSVASCYKHTAPAEHGSTELSG